MLLMGNLHNYRGACQPRPCSPFRIGQVWRIWPATFDRCKNERTLHRAGAHAERGELTDKERDRQTICHCCCTTMRNCGRRASNVACSAHIELQLKSQLAAGRSLPQLMPQSLPACCQMPNATQHRQQTTQTSVAGSLCYDAATHTQQPSRTCMPAQSTTYRKETICNTHTHTNENYITSCWNTRLSKYIHKWICTCIHRKRNASAAYERAASNTYPWPLVVAFYSIYSSSCGLFLYSSSALSRFRDIILIL